MIQCTFEDGGEGKLRHVVVDAVILKEDKVLLVKRSEKLSTEPGKWALVGGFMDRDENGEQTVIREAFEETGYRLQNVQLLTVVDDPNRPGDDRQNIKLIFMAEALEKEGEHDWEVEEIKWFDLDNLPEVIAFDHRQFIDLYIEYKNKKISLPEFVKIT